MSNKLTCAKDDFRYKKVSRTKNYPKMTLRKVPENTHSILLRFDLATTRLQSKVGYPE